jgi:hypothetical protein
VSSFIRDLIAQHLPAQAAYLPIVDVVLVKLVNGTRTSSALAAGTNPTSTSYPCQGFSSSYKEGAIDGTLVKSTDLNVRIIGGTLPDGLIPEAGDKFQLVNELGVTETYRVIGGSEGKGVTWDPAKALFKCHARKAP